MVEITLFVLNVILCGPAGCIPLEGEFATMQECQQAVNDTIEIVVAASRESFVSIEFTDPPCVMISTWGMES